MHLTIGLLCYPDAPDDTYIKIFPFICPSPLSQLLFHTFQFECPGVIMMRWKTLMGLSEIKKDIVGKNKLLYVILQLIT